MGTFAEIFLLAIFLTNINAQASESAASLFLVGVVEEVIDIYIEPEPGALGSLDLINGEASKTIATASERFNGVNGYQVSIESTNSGSLVHSNGSNQVDYFISYDGNSSTKPGSIGSGVVVKTVPGALSGLTTATSSIDINIPVGSANSIPGGVYTDTLILVISSI